MEIVELLIVGLKRGQQGEGNDEERVGGEDENGRF